MYAKVYGSILKSSIWDEALPTRVLWITMLVLADEHGYVKGVEKGLARAANISAEELKAGLETLLAPDLDSQSQEWGGRRIEKVEGGWLVLNYAKYREYRTRSQVLAAHRAARHREKERTANPMADNDERYSSRPSRPVTPIATASASAGSTELPRARDNEDGETAASSLATAQTALLAREHGTDAGWCSECWGRRVTIGGSPHLRHQDWCSRRQR